MLCHVGDGRLAVGAGHTRHIEMTRGPSVELGGDLAKAGPGRRHLEHRRVGRKLDRALDRDGDRAGRDGIARICVSVGPDPAYSHEQVAALDVPRVVSNPAHLNVAAAFERGPRHTARQVFEPHVRFAA